MTTRPLLDRQVSLLRHLTEPRLIFAETGGAPVDPSCRGLDPERLRLVARLSFNKRMAKVRLVLPKTIALLGTQLEPVTRGFAEVCAPTSIGRYDNARQFHDCLVARWREYPPELPYLPDVVRYEIAYAEASVRTQQDEVSAGGAPADSRCVRRHPNTVLVRLGHDVRALFDDAGDTGPVDAREVGLVITLRHAVDQPRVFEVRAPIFERLQALDDWTPIESPEAEATYRTLAAHAMIEFTP